VFAVGLQNRDQLHVSVISFSPVTLAQRFPKNPKESKIVQSIPKRSKGVQEFTTGTQNIPIREEV